MKDLARGLHPTAGGNFLRAKQLPNFIYDRTSVRKIMSDWYDLDWPGNESGVTLEKLKMVLDDIGLRLEISPTEDAVVLQGIPNEEETKRCIGLPAWNALLEAFDLGEISEAQAQAIATKLNPYTGGWFKRARDSPNFKFNRSAFKRILMDWVARTEKE